MSGTRRTPISRIGTLLQITSRALELFEATEKGRRKRRAAGCVVGVYGQCRMECGACQTWAAAHSELHSELRLRPWQWPCLPICPRLGGGAGLGAERAGAGALAEARARTPRRPGGRARGAEAGQVVISAHTLTR
jgi:hypothetical protein